LIKRINHLDQSSLIGGPFNAVFYMMLVVMSRTVAWNQ
jgi:hypothetical protein